MLRTVRTQLVIGKSRRRIGSTPASYKTAVRKSLEAQYPGVTNVKVTLSGEQPPDTDSPEPYERLTAEGTWDDGKE